MDGKNEGVVIEGDALEGVLDIKADVGADMKGSSVVLLLENIIVPKTTAKAINIINATSNMSL